MEQVKQEIDSMMAEAEGQIASEKLGGNIVKEEFWRGQLSGLRAVYAMLHDQSKLPAKETEWRRFDEIEPDAGSYGWIADKDGIVDPTPHPLTAGLFMRSDYPYYFPLNIKQPPPPQPEQAEWEKALRSHAGPEIILATAEKMAFKAGYLAAKKGAE